MNLKGIISIAGMSGLYKVIAQTKNGGFVVEGITDGKRFPVSSTSRISALEDISIYAENEDVLLSKILDKIKETHGSDLPVQPKDEPSKLRSFLKTILPEYDEERVFPSDIKKIVSWYSLVKDLPEEEKTEEIPATEEVAEGEKPKAKSKDKEEKTEKVAKAAKKPAKESTAKKSEGEAADAKPKKTKKQE